MNFPREQTTNDLALFPAYGLSKHGNRIIFFSSVQRSVGPLIGLQSSLEPYSWLDLYVRGTQVVGFGDATTSLGLFEVGLSVRPYSHLAFDGGYRIMKYRKIGPLTERIGPGQARIDLGLSGPMVGLRLDF